MAEQARELPPLPEPLRGLLAMLFPELFPKRFKVRASAFADSEEVPVPVVLDGRTYHTPLLVEVEEGTHSFYFPGRHDGAELSSVEVDGTPARQSFELDVSGDTEITARYVRPPPPPPPPPEVRTHTLTVRAYADAREVSVPVRVSGAERTSPFSVELEEGAVALGFPGAIEVGGERYEFRSADGWGVPEFTFTLDRDREIHARYELVPVPPPPKREHVLTVRAYADAREVSVPVGVDGYRGSTPMRLTLAEGRYVLSAPSSIEVEGRTARLAEPPRAIDLTEDTALELRYELEPAPPPTHTLTVRAWADGRQVSVPVEVDGRRGETPLELELPAGMHRVRAPSSIEVDGRTARLRVPPEAAVDLREDRTVDFRYAIERVIEHTLTVRARADGREVNVPFRAETAMPSRLIEERTPWSGPVPAGAWVTLSFPSRLELEEGGALAEFALDPGSVPDRWQMVGDREVTAVYRFDRYLTRPVVVRVTDADTGEPVEGVSVELEGPEILTGTTNARGEARFGRVPLGPYRITLVKRGYEAKSATRTVGAPAREAPVKTLLLNFVLKREVPPAPTYAVTVRVFDGSTREPIPGAEVLMDGKPVGTTGPDGTLRVERVPEGRHRFEARARGYQPRAVGVDVPASLSVGIGLEPAPPAPAPVVAGDIVKINYSTPIYPTKDSAFKVSVRWRNTGNQIHAFDLAAALVGRTDGGVYAFGVTEDVHSGPGDTFNTEVVLRVFRDMPDNQAYELQVYLCEWEAGRTAKVYDSHRQDATEWIHW
ncbi:MAG: carboxypeptidase regulatory-like domain-containing protein [Deltaproteobacteria bacterium]|nr:carboxypeptidase regulatory-like domain-containing protein [Deltaproteobacteria bacterium]MBW2672945.1 carboxypeptidase regulatory-like domain-containing protein [Deltaproteobacteria bacterium]